MVFTGPLVVMVLGSLQRPLQPPPEGLALWPDPPSWTNYRDVGSFLPWGRLLLNSLLVALVAVPVTVVVTSWAGLAIVTAARGMRAALVAVSVAMALVPAAALWVPRVVVLRQFGLTDHTLSVAVLALAGTTPFYVLLFALAYAQIPSSVLEAAQLEGLSPYAVWRRVAFPLVRPAAGAVAALAFVYYWSTFMDPLTLVTSPDRWPLALGLRGLADMEAALYPIFLTGAVIATAPAVLVFLAAQRSFFSTAGAGS